MEKKLHMVSLGCAKNLINSEQMLAALLDAGYAYCEEPEEADIIVINTCAFIESAKSEAIENILEMAEYKNSGALVGLVVTGCLAQRYGEQLFEEMPEIDAVVGVGSFDEIVEVCDGLLAAADAGTLGQNSKTVRMGDINGPLCELPRLVTTPEYTAYIKIADGCDNHCAYCVIPQLRGKYRSREMGLILEEAKMLVSQGAKELIVIAQDISAYGTDLYGKRCLPELLHKLCALDGLEWVRLHYLYPDEIDDELIECLASEPKILHYLDIPIQHVSARILKAMNRRYTRSDIEKLVRTLRKRLPGLVLRTSLIVGLPGETDEEFAELCDFMQRMKFQKVGVFTYSQEEGTIAAEMPDQIDEDVKLKRQDTIMDIQDRILTKYNKSLIGRTITVLTEGYDRSAGCYYGRSYAESLDVDGKIFFLSPDKKIQSGEFVKVRINDEIDGDPIGDLAE